MSLNANAQKIGSFSESYVVNLIPEVKKIDSIVSRYIKDSLIPMRESIIKEINSIDAISRTCGGAIDSSLIQKQNRLPELFYQLANWITIFNESIEKKRKILLEPFRSQVRDALKLVILTGKYTQVIDSEALVIPLPICDNLTIKVAKYLQLKLPNDSEDKFEKGNCKFQICLAEE